MRSFREVHRSHISSEEVAGWFLRLNGCLNVRNFILHPDRSGPQRTDADVLGVRFPHRQELGGTDRPLVDHPAFEGSRFVDLVIAEVKGAHDYCQLNGPWTDPAKGNLGYVLRAIGMFPKDRSEVVARELYERYRFDDGERQVRLLAFGGLQNDELDAGILQLTWVADVLPFIYKRFSEHARQKSQNEQWDDAGRDLYQSAVSARTAEEFADAIIGRML